MRSWTVSFSWSVVQGGQKCTLQVGKHPFPGTQDSWGSPWMNKAVEKKWCQSIKGSFLFFLCLLRKSFCLPIFTTAAIQRTEEVMPWIKAKLEEHTWVSSYGFTNSPSLFLRSLDPDPIQNCEIGAICSHLPPSFLRLLLWSLSLLTGVPSGHTPSVSVRLLWFLNQNISALSRTC